MEPPLPYHLLTNHTMDQQIEFLVLDDDEIFIYLIKNVLEKSGHANAVHIFSTTPEALSWIYNRIDRGEALPGLMIVDIRMPIMTGIEMLGKLSKLPADIMKDVGVCMLTSSLAEADKNASMAYPFVFDYLSKPFSREKLSALVEKYQKLERV